MNNLNLMELPELPLEIVNIIADYHDFEKYCKPAHKKLLTCVLKDIISMGEIMYPISAKIAWDCWGPGSKYLNTNYENIIATEEFLEFDDDESESNDDEENNFGLDYDETYYYGQSIYY